VTYACLILRLPLFSSALQVVLVGPLGHGKAALYGLLLVNLGVVARHTIERIVQSYGVRSVLHMQLITSRSSMLIMMTSP
jgi:hypothetical protein